MAIIFRYKHIKRKDVRLVLVHRRNEILNMLPVYYSRKCRQQLEKLGVEICLGCDVKEVGPDFIRDQHKKKYAAGTIFWCVGFRPATVPLDKKPIDIYHVTHTFNVEGFRDIFALGDCAYLEQENGKRVPMLAQVAEEQSKYVVQNVLCRLGVKATPRVYRFQLKGFLLSVGEYFAVAGLNFGTKTVYFSGFFAWWFWRTIYLSKLVGVGNKIRVAMDWTLNFLYPRDTSEIE